MVSRSIVKMGNPQLATPSNWLENFEHQGMNYPGLSELIQDMLDTMQEKGGVGIAAPQIGCNLRIILFGFEKSDRYPNEQPVPFTILVNPIFKVLSPEMNDAWEGCLSVPGLRGLVSRFTHIEYSGFDPQGKRIIRRAEGFHARVVQHECDHLEGILYPQRLKNVRDFGYEDELLVKNNLH